MKKLLLTLLLVSAVVAHAAPAPTLIPFQGRLTDQAGAIYTTGQYTLIFNLYDQAVGGNVLWTETHQKVGVVNGMVNVFLGSINPALASLDFSQTRHLGITIDADNNPNTPDPEMVPRQMIIPAFAAKNSEKLAGHDWSALLVSGNNPATGQLRGNKIQMQGITTNELAQAVIDQFSPPGTITAFAGPPERIPVGWLLCDGSAFKSTAYARLYAAIDRAWGNGSTSGTGARFAHVTSGAGQTDFNVPDLRGYFLRGVDGGAGRDPSAPSREAIMVGGNLGNTVGTGQWDAFQGHRLGDILGNRLARVFMLPGTQPADHPFYGPAGGTGGHGYHSDLFFITDGVNGTPRTSSETRPLNAYVHYIIKY